MFVRVIEDAFKKNECLRNFMLGLKERIGIKLWKKRNKTCDISIYERFDCPEVKLLDLITKKTFGTHTHTRIPKFDTKRIYINL